MTEDSAIRIDLTLQSVYTLPTHGASPPPNTPGTRPTGSLELAPASIELDISNETDMPRVPSYRITDILTQVMSWVARCHPDTTTAWLQPSRGTNLSQTGTGPKHNWLSRLPPFARPKATAARSLPTLVNTRKRSPPIYRIKAFPLGNCGCTKRARFGGTWSTFRLGA